MLWSTSVLSTVSSDTEPTIIVNFDNAKYIFNAGENTNRSFLQNKANWRKCRGIFFSQIDTKRTSGLTGLIMSLADATMKRLEIVGPPGMTHLVASMRSYTFRDSMAVNTVEIDGASSTQPEPAHIYKDENITVYAVPIVLSLKSDESRSVAWRDTVDLPSEGSLKRKREPSPDQPQKRKPVDPEASSTSLSALMENQDFTPETLEGRLADEWRRKIVSTMFPATNVKQETKKKEPQKGKKGKRGRDEQILASAPAPGPPAEEEGKGDQQDNYRRSRARVPQGYHMQLPKFTRTDSSIDSKTPFVYVVIGPQIRGKFNVKKATELGVFNADRARITRGQTITVPIKKNGQVVGERIVKPEDCMDPAQPPAATLILDVPTPDHIPSVVSAFTDHPFYRRYRSTDAEDMAVCDVHTVYHLCGDGVLEDERYIQFMNGFKPTAHHIISSREHTPNFLTFTSFGYNQLRLNQLDPEMFPKPAFSITAKKNISDITNLPANSHLMAANMVVIHRPPGQPHIEPSAIEADRFHPIVKGEIPLAISEDARKRFAVARARVAKCIAENKCRTGKGVNIGILPLGTGSALPTKYRNVSSTLIQIPDWGNILLDAGEGTWGQLARHFGVDNSNSPNVWQVLRDLKCIFASHIHADHHMGLAKILAMRRTLDPPPPDSLYLVSVRTVHLYLREMSDVLDLGIGDRSARGVIPIMTEAVHWRKADTYVPTGMWQIGGREPWTDIHKSRHHATEMCSILGLSGFDTVDVRHKCKAYGAVITHEDGWRIVFSGDTMPTRSLVEAGRFASVLIHEATMGDDEEVMAKNKAHSTFGQAVEIGRNMNAENILLTHFSARYPKLPPSMVTPAGDIDDASKDGPTIALAFDHARLTIGNMWKLGYYLPALEKTIHDTAAEEGDEEELVTSAPVVTSVDMS